jgi:hypothetical protein
MVEAIEGRSRLISTSFPLGVEKFVLTHADDVSLDMVTEGKVTSYGNKNVD